MKISFILLLGLINAFNIGRNESEELVRSERSDNGPIIRVSDSPRKRHRVKVRVRVKNPFG